MMSWLFRTKWLAVVTFAVLCGVILGIGNMACSSKLTPTAASTPTLVSISIAPALDITLQAGSTQYFEAEGTYSDGSTKNISSLVSWSSSDHSVAIMSSSGLATGIDAGTVKIYVSLSEVTSSPVTITVVPGPVTSTQTPTPTTVPTSTPSATTTPTPTPTVPAIPSAANSVIAAYPPTISPDGSSTAAIAVVEKDANNNNLQSSGVLPVLTTTLGKLSKVTDNGHGSYTATLTSSETQGVAIITGTINGVRIGTSANVTFGPSF